MRPVCCVLLLLTAVPAPRCAAVDASVKLNDDTFLEGSVASLDKEEQSRIVLRERRACVMRMIRELESGEDWPGCPTEFDRVMCWPRTPPNTLLVQPCPNYIDGFVLNRNASRVCTPNGTWYRLEASNASWTNFTECLRKPNAVGKRHFYIIRTIGHIGYAVSALSLSSAIFIMIYFKRLHCPRNTVHINLFSAFLIRCLANFISLGINNQREDWLCKLFFTFQTYAIVNSYTWISIEALYLHNVIFIHVMTEENYKQLLFYILAGWGTPLAVGVVWALLRLFYDDSYCWNRRQQDSYNRAYWFTTSYSILLVLTNLSIFINIIRVLFVKMRHEPTADRYRKLARSTLVLVVVFGIYYIVCVPLDILEAYGTRVMSLQLNIAKLYYQHTLSTFQGFLVALLFCFVNGEVTSEIRRRISRYKMMRDTRGVHSSNVEDLRVQSGPTSAGKRRIRASVGLRRQGNSDTHDANDALMSAPAAETTIKSTANA